MSPRCLDLGQFMFFGLLDHRVSNIYQRLSFSAAVPIDETKSSIKMKIQVGQFFASFSRCLTVQDVCTDEHHVEEEPKHVFPPLLGLVGNSIVGTPLIIFINSIVVFCVLLNGDGLCV